MTAEDPRIGMTIDGRYHVRRLIGRGGMGVVYEADHLKLERRVAIKFLLDTRRDQTTLERFRREGRMASRVVNEHVVQIYDVGLDGDGNDYIAMEYVEGRDLAQVLRAEGPLGVTRATTMIRAMLEGLHAIHREDIVHRDVKPSNVLLTRRGDDRDFVKIMDFGVARSLRDETLTAAGHAVGTTEFMAPEQLRGEPVDLRADLYAVGVTLFAMLAGDVPFAGSTARVVARHVYETPPSLDQVRSGLPAPIVAAVARALAKSPGDRFQDALAFASALDGKPPQRPSDPAPSLSAPTAIERPMGAPAAPRRRRAWPIVAAALLGVAIAVLAWLRTGGDVIAPRDASVARVVALEPASVPPSTPAIDAAAIPDAPIALDAAPPDAAARVTHADNRRVTKHCRCIGPDNIALCPKQGPSLCRCDGANGRPLCLTRLIACDATFRHHQELKRIGKQDEDVCENALQCSDMEWDRFHVPGKVDTPCSGYPTTPHAEERVDPNGPVRPGHLECDACPGAITRVFDGQRGAMCAGFYWRTGEPTSGTLGDCE